MAVKPLAKVPQGELHRAGANHEDAARRACDFARGCRGDRHSPGDRQRVDAQPAQSPSMKHGRQCSTPHQHKEKPNETRRQSRGP
jgi:hypothetical protein